MSIVVASILDADWTRLREEVEAVDKAGVDAFSIDIMDGHFAPRITFGPHILAQIRNWTALPIEAHLMVNEPAMALEVFCDAGCDQILFHLEATDTPQELVDYVHSRGLLVGVALLAETPLDAISDSLLAELDVVNLLAVPVGFGGAETASDTPARIESLRRRADVVNPALAIEVDGGVKPDNCVRYAEVGADMLTIGTGIYHSPDYRRAVADAQTALAPFVGDSAAHLHGFLARPSTKLTDDEARRERLDFLRASLDIPKRTWDPISSQR